MESLIIKPGHGLDGYNWAVFENKLKPKTYHVDVFVSPKGILLGWLITKHGQKMTTAKLAPEGMTKTQDINLLNQGCFIGVFASRILAGNAVTNSIAHSIAENPSQSPLISPRPK